MNYANFDYFQSTGSNSGNMLAYGPDAEVSVILTRNGGESLGIEPATKRSIHSPLTDWDSDRKAKENIIIIVLIHVSPAHVQLD